MTKKQKYEMAALAVKNGISPEQLRVVVKYFTSVGEGIIKAFNENMKVLNELFPEVNEEVIDDE